MTARGPVPLLASLPGSLHREPGDELVVVGISNRARHVAVVVTVPNEADDTVLGDACEQITRDRATSAVLVGYGTDSKRLALVGGLLPTLGVLVLDVLAVHDGRWRSLACDDPSCCPPEGNPLPTPTENQETPAP